MPIALVADVGAYAAAVYRCVSRGGLGGPSVQAFPLRGAQDAIKVTKVSQRGANWCDLSDFKAWISFIANDAKEPAASQANHFLHLKQFRRG